MKVNILKQFYNLFGAKFPYFYVINPHRQKSKTVLLSDETSIGFKSLGKGFQVKLCYDGIVVIREIKKENGVNTSIETLIVKQ
jgi:hypothetical protein